MIKHRLQEMHGARLTLPGVARLRPDVLALDERFTEFLTC